MTTYKASTPRGNATRQALGLAAGLAAGEKLVGRRSKTVQKEEPKPKTGPKTKAIVDRINVDLARRQGRKSK